MKKLKHLYKDNELVIFGCLVVVPLVLGMFVNAPWLLIVLDAVGLFAGLKFISMANAAKHVDININGQLPERVEFEGQVYYRCLFHQVRENDFYWGIEYKNLYDEFLPHMEDTFTTVDYDNKISLESLINIVHDKLKEFNYV